MIIHFNQGLFFVLVEEGFKHDDFISRFDEAHECAEDSFVGAGSDCDFGLWVDVPAEQGRVGFRNCFLEPWSPLWFSEPPCQPF